MLLAACWTTLEAVVLCLVIALLGWMLIDLVRTELATRRGTADAHADISRGEFRYNVRGLARAWDRTAIDIARSDYGIQIVRTGGCVCAGPDCSYDLAYNRVVCDHFTRKLGYDPIERAYERAYEQARRDWKKQRSDAIELENDVAKPSHALEPAAGSVPSGVSSPPAPVMRVVNGTRRTMTKAAPVTIVNVGYRSTNYWVVSTGTSRLLVDIGWPGTLGNMKANLKRMGVPLHEIRYTLATHYHIDHAGLAEELKREGIPLLVLDVQVDAIPLMRTWTKPQDNYVEIASTKRFFCQFVFSLKSYAVILP